MKNYRDFSRSMGAVNFSIILHHRKQIQDFQDILIKAYNAGTITHYGKLIVYGTGAERGTWGRFANVHIEGTDVFVARNSLTWFSNIYSAALRNQGHTNRKRNFYLSQLQEINPLLMAFGLKDEFNAIWDEIEEHDLENDLDNEWEQCGKIESWETRTMKAVVTFKDREVEILDSITTCIMNESKAIEASKAIPNLRDLIGNAFIEGTRGYCMSSTDLDLLIQNSRIAA